MSLINKVRLWPRKKQLLAYYLVASMIIYLFAEYIVPLVDNYIYQSEDSITDILFTYYMNYKATYGKILVIVCGGIVLLASGSLVASVLGLSIILLVLSVADRTMYESRLELLNYKDLKLSEAFGTAGKSISFSWGRQLWTLLLAIILFICISLFARRVFIGLKKGRILYRCVFVVVFIVILFVTQYYYVGRGQGDNSIDIYTENGKQYALFRFFESKIEINKEETIVEAYNNFGLHKEDNSVSEGFRPNIICIMNESWWNMDNAEWADGVKLSLDPMEPYHRLEEKCQSGYVSVNTFGGGTSASEFEFLTGLNSKYFESSSTVFSSLADKENVLSCVNYYNNLGYETKAVHPYYGDFYSRNTVYQKMGFDKMVFEDEMLYREPYNKFISDDSFVKQLIYEYENSEKNTPLFMWGVSVANHIDLMDYVYEFNEEYEYPISIEIPDEMELTEKEYKRLISYVNGIYLSNLAYEKLVEYFEKVNEPTVIMMYGDHCPMWIGNNITMMGLDQGDNKYKMRQTPVLLWKNYDNVGTNDVDISGYQVGMLNTVLFDYAGLNQPAIVKILSEVKKYIKADTHTYTLSEDGNIILELDDKQRNYLVSFKSIQNDIYNGGNVLGNLWLD